MRKGKWRTSFNVLAASALVVSAVAPVMPTAVYAEAGQALSVEEAIANNSGIATVRGYIVGYVKSATSVVTTGVEDTNIAIADNPNETDVTKMLFVQLTSSYRSEFGLKSNPAALGKQIDVTGSLEAYFTKAGLKSPSAIQFTDGVTEPELPIEGEAISIAEARSTATGAEVTVKGIVTAKLKNTIAVQDATGGIAVRPTSLNVVEGDVVTLKGTLADYRGLLQLDKTAVVSKESGQLVQPKLIAGAEVDERNESQLVKVQNVTLTKDSEGAGWANYKATDSEGNTFIVRDEKGDLGLTENPYASIAGIVQQFDNDYQIIPRSSVDVVIDSSLVLPPVATPAGGTFIGGTTVTLTSTTANAEILYTLDGVDPKIGGATYAEPIQIDKDTTLKAVIKTVDNVYSDVITMDYTIVDALRIHDIQGASHTSTYNNKVVEGVEGIVTSSYEVTGSTYYTIQTPDELVDNDPNTSEGILLYSGRNKWPIAVGDLVSVTGKVSEYAIEGYAERQTTDLLTTQINVRDDQGGKVTVLKKNVALPKPIVIDANNLPTSAIDSDQLTVFNPETDAIDFWESLESMRVQVSNVKAVGPQANGDLVTVLESKATNTKHGGMLLEKDNKNPDLIQFRLDPNGEARSFEVATGDKFVGDIVGVVGYSYQNYKIYTALATMQNAHVKGTVTPEQTHIMKDGKKLTIASYNLENFSNNTKETSADKAGKLARAFVKDLQSPDIVGVTEVQDNNGSSAGDSAANESYERLINEIVKAGGVQYAYANIDPVNNADGGAPNANIRVGFLYNPERVTLADLPAGDATTAVGYENGNLTLNPGRIDPQNDAFQSSRKPLAAQFDFNGEQVIVVVNHWNSKNGDTPLYGSKQPPYYGSEVQRKKIATIVEDFIHDVKTKNPNANIVAVGDFNDFQFSDALGILESRHMTNMINKLPENDRYTYVFQGNSQVLDHILVSNNLAAKTEVDAIHINADFTDMAGRASDHDPVLVQVDVKPTVVEPEPENPGKDKDTKPNAPIKHFTYHNVNDKKLKINGPNVAVEVTGTTFIKEGIEFKGAYGEFTGDALKNNVVLFAPAHKNAVLDFKGAEVKKLIIDGTKAYEVRGADNIKEIVYTNGAKAENIKFSYVGGSKPVENTAPIVTKSFDNVTVKSGETVTIDVTKHFADSENDKLTFTATLGELNNGVLTLQLAEGTHIVAVTANDGKLSTTARFTVTVESKEQPNDYYSAAYGKEGAALKAALHSIISEHKKLSYDQVWDALKQTDEDPNNPNNVILLYSGESRAKNLNGGNVGNWNREHVWAKSHGNFGTSVGPGTDIHHLRATDVQVNSTRGNLDFDNGGSSVKGCDGCFKTSTSFEPPNRVKGDVARMLFYMATRYEQGDRVDLELNEKLNNGTSPYHGKLSVLLQWHLQDPVDEIERQRNEKIYEIQGNRNPFIDHPEWVQLIWPTATAMPKAS
ncbi:endonuclease [Bacillus ndiopicus]|uniref:endonuclease n=1 Tax=Bacillus ndiopicus TaxID=1347368 RepID=UPI0005A90196|nr:endonuclease [Bacillus ndiopicus]